MRKRIIPLLTLAIAAIMTLSFQSCSDDDDYVAYSLEGTWEGYMDIYYEYGGVEYESTYSELYFDRDPYEYSSGSGYWIDYYSNYGWGRNYIANHITWTVNGGRIYVRFLEEGTSIEIMNYSISDDYFVGDIYMDGVTTHFQLTHTSSPNWNNFVYGYDFYDYGYSKQNASVIEAPRRFLGTDSIKK